MSHVCKEIRLGLVRRFGRFFGFGQLCGSQYNPALELIAVTFQCWEGQIGNGPTLRIVDDDSAILRVIVPGRSRESSSSE